MEKILYILLLFACGIVISGCSADHQDFAHRQNGPAYIAWIETQSCNSGLKVLAFCQNNTSQDVVLRYELKAKKTGSAGTADTFQAGSVEIPSGQKKSLSQLGLNFSAGDRYRIQLKVYKDGKLVAEDFVSYPKGL